MLNRHLVAYAPVYLAQGLVGFGAVAVFTRILTPDEYGRYVLILAGASLIGTLIFTWLDAAIARYHARATARGRLPGQLFTAWRIFAVLALPTVAVGVLGLWLVPLEDSVKAACAFAFAYTVIRSGLTLALETRRAGGEAWRYSLLETFTLAGGFGFGVVLALTGLGAAGPFAGMLLAASIALLIDAPILLSRSKRDRADAKRAVTFFAYGAPVAVSLLFEHLLSVGDRFVIAAFLGEAAAGTYAAGYAVADRSLSIIFLWLGATTGPLLIAAFEHHGAREARNVAQRTAGLMALIGFPAAAGLALVADPISQVLIGPEIAAEAAGIIPFIALSGLLNGFMTFYFHEAYVLGRKPRSMAIIMAVCAMFNIALNLILTPLLGLVGAALATVLCYAIALGVCVVHGRGVFALPIPVRAWFSALGATLVMAGVIIWVPSPQPALLALICKVALGAGVYAMLALALNIADCRSWIPKRAPVQEAPA